MNNQSTNNDQPTQLFNISKSYEGSPSKNKPKYHTGHSWEDSINLLNSTEAAWRRNGGTIISRTESELIVEESDGSETITFSIEEA